MSSQDISSSSVSSATVPEVGGSNLVAETASTRPNRNRFADFDDFRNHLSQVLGAKLEGDGVRGSISRRRGHSGPAAAGRQPVTYGDPVLDAIFGPDGLLVIGDQTINLREGGGLGTGSIGADRSVIAHAVPHLTMTGIVNGAERWVSNDGSL